MLITIGLKWSCNSSWESHLGIKKRSKFHKKPFIEGQRTISELFEEQVRTQKLKASEVIVQAKFQHMLKSESLNFLHEETIRLQTLVDNITEVNVKLESAMCKIIDHLEIQEARKKQMEIEIQATNAMMSKQSENVIMILDYIAKTQKLSSHQLQPTILPSKSTAEQAPLYHIHSHYHYSYYEQSTAKHYGSQYPQKRHSYKSSKPRYTYRWVPTGRKKGSDEHEVRPMEIDRIRS